MYTPMAVGVAGVEAAAFEEEVVDDASSLSMSSALRPETGSSNSLRRCFIYVCERESKRQRERKSVNKLRFAP